MKALICFLLSVVALFGNRCEMIRLGSDYGGWNIPKDLLNQDSVCYLCGAGEDITFDVEVAKKYGCTVHIFDPTPRAQVHFKTFTQAIKSGKTLFPTPKSPSPYSLHKELLAKMHFHPVGVWGKNETMRFFAPQNPTHVSHSILNLQKTEQYFDAECKALSSIMQELNHKHISLLKLDIEGAEYEVLGHLLQRGCNVDTICVEFDEFAGINAHFSNQKEATKKVKKMLSLLKKHGYVLVYQNTYTDMTFVKEDVLKKFPSYKKKKLISFGRMKRWIKSLM